MEQLNYFTLLFELIPVLESNRIPCTPSQAEDICSVLHDCGNGFTEEEFLQAAVPLLAKTPEEWDAVEEIIRTYLHQRHGLQSEIEQARRQDAERREHTMQSMEGLQKKIEKAQQGQEAFRQGEDAAEREYKKALEKLAKELQKKAPAYPEIRKMSKGMPDLEKILKGEEDADKAKIQKMKEGLPSLAGKAMGRKDAMQILSSIAALQEILDKLEKAMEKRGRDTLAGLQEQEREYRKKKQEKEQELKHSSEELEQKIRQIINRKVSVHIKEKSIRHRDMFRPQGSAVQALHAEPEFLDQTFSGMRPEEKEQVREYIRENIRKFRTRVARNIRTGEHRRLRMSETIKNCCKGGGIPLDLIFEKGVRDKTKLALFLDISGSCRNASELMLTFAYYLQEIFPAGCFVGAFVDYMYDVSYIMKENDVDMILKVMREAIPTRGVYSDYGSAFRSACEEHLSKVTKDTICIFIGDARNNDNESGEEYVKKIARKCRAAYWLNTEAPGGWDSGDSIMGTYRPYMKETCPVLSPKDLIQFLMEM